MILTKKSLDRLRSSNFFCAKLTNEQADKLLELFGKEPATEHPFVWDEEHIWFTIRKMIDY